MLTQYQPAEKRRFKGQETRQQDTRMRGGCMAKPQIDQRTIADAADETEENEFRLQEVHLVAQCPERQQNDRGHAKAQRHYVIGKQLTFAADAGDEHKARPYEHDKERVDIAFFMALRVGHIKPGF